MVTPHEFELLYQLASQPGVVLSRKELLAAVWRGQAFVTERSIDTLVRHLRHMWRIKKNPANPELIVTVWGYGYKLAIRRPIWARSLYSADVLGFAACIAGVFAVQATAVVLWLKSVARTINA